MKTRRKHSILPFLWFTLYINSMDFNSNASSTKCIIDGCNNKVYDGHLCHSCWGKKKYRLQSWRTLKRKERSKLSKEARFKQKQAGYGDFKRERLDERNLGAMLRGSSVQTKFKGGKSGAIRRGLDWNISFEEYKNLLLPGVCHYCGNPLPPKGVGLDRKDNAQGYLLSNVVACCGRCNSIKGPHLTYCEMLVVGAMLKNRSTNERTHLDDAPQDQEPRLR